MRIESGASIKRLKSLKYRGALSVAVSLSFTLACAPEAELDWDGVKQLIRAEYPNVDLLSTADLVGLLSSVDGKDLILLDARSSEEYNVSHLRGAQLTPSERAASNVLEGADPDRLIVVYGSVGYRSASMVQRLMDRGYTNIHSLEGGLFEWANYDLPRFRGNKQVQAVHPFDRAWGQFLRADLWAAVLDSPDTEGGGGTLGQH